MVAPSETMDNTVRDFQKLKTSLHRQMVDAIDFSKAEDLSEIELRGQLRSLADYLCTRQSLSLDSRQREAMVSVITGWKAELLTARRQAMAEGHLKSSFDAPQMVCEIYGLMLAMHQDARLLRSADSAKRARAGLRRLLDSARTAKGPAQIPTRRTAPRASAARTAK